MLTIVWPVAAQVTAGSLCTGIVVVECPVDLNTGRFVVAAVAVGDRLQYTIDARLCRGGVKSQQQCAAAIGRHCSNGRTVVDQVAALGQCARAGRSR